MVSGFFELQGKKRECRTFFLKKMKIKPSLREKKRYVGYRILSQSPINRDIGRAVEEHVKRCLGLFDGAEAGIMSVRYSRRKQEGVLKMGNTFVNKVKVAIMLMNPQDLGIEQDFSAHTILTSGSLIKLESIAS